MTTASPNRRHSEHHKATEEEGDQRILEKEIWTKKCGQQDTRTAEVSRRFMSKIAKLCLNLSKLCLEYCIESFSDTVSYVPTADQINSTFPITQIPRQSPTIQALHDLFPTACPIGPGIGLAELEWIGK